MTPAKIATEMYTPFPDQEKLLDGVRASLRAGHRRIIIQSPTGSGKTVTACFMIDGMVRNDLTVWFVAPRQILVEQISSSLSKFNIPHGVIWGDRGENRHFSVHVVSRDTLTRRLDKIKNPPMAIIWDECHEGLDIQIMVANHFPGSYFFGLSATPELENRSFADLYTDCVLGEPIHVLQQAGRLSTPRYYMPPMDGIDQLPWSGSEPDEDAMADFFARQKVYGKTIDQWRDKTPDKPTVVFCRSIKAAEETAHQFRSAGHNFQCIEGSMTKKKRKALFDGFKSGEVIGLTCADLLTYGVDLPIIASLIMLKRTRSIRMFYQMIGRELRISPDGDPGAILDQVNNFATFGYYADPINPHKWNVWNDAGIKQERKARQITMRQCPHIDWMMCYKATCAGCEHAVGKPEKKPIIINCDLTEYTGDHASQDATEPAKRPAYQDDLDRTVEHLRIAVTAPEVERMVKYANAMGYNRPNGAMWIYDQINNNRHAINVALLSAIGAAYGFAPGWVWVKQKEMRKRR